MPSGKNELALCSFEVYNREVMEESKLETMPCSPTVNSGNEKNSRYRWMVNWVALLTTVFLFASSLNCLFLWLAYGYKHDVVGLAFSLVLSLLSYFQVLNPRRAASLQRRLFLSVTALLIWAVFMPVIMHLSGMPNP